MCKIKHLCLSAQHINLENLSSYHVRDGKCSFTYFTSFLKLNSFKLQILLARQINFMHFYKN